MPTKQYMSFLLQPRDRCLGIILTPSLSAGGGFGEAMGTGFAELASIHVELPQPSVLDKPPSSVLRSYGEVGAGPQDIPEEQGTPASVKRTKVTNILSKRLEVPISYAGDEKQGE